MAFVSHFFYGSYVIRKTAAHIMFNGKAFKVKELLCLSPSWLVWYKVQDFDTGNLALSALSLSNKTTAGKVRERSWVMTNTSKTKDMPLRCTLCLLEIIRKCLLDIYILYSLFVQLTAQR